MAPRRRMTPSPRRGETRHRKARATRPTGGRRSLVEPPGQRPPFPPADDAVAHVAVAAPRVAPAGPPAHESPAVVLFRRDARCGHLDDAATLDDFREAVEILESVAPLRIRIFGEAHPETPRVKHALATAREKLARALASAATAAGSAEEKS